MLQELKSLKKFNCIKFKDTTHQYFINDTLSNGSITSVISHVKPKFDTDKWSKYKAKQRGVEQAVILEEWKQSGIVSTHLGTLLHSYIEHYWCNKIKDTDEDNLNNIFSVVESKKILTLLDCFKQSFHTFYHKHQHLLPIKSELVIGDVYSSRVCGTLDMLVYNEELNCFEIYDFKTNKNFTHRNNYSEHYINPVISHLEVCDLNSYSLQQSLYKYIIEKYTTLKIKNCFLLWFDRETQSCEKILCKDLTQYCEVLLTDYSLHKSTSTL